MFALAVGRCVKHVLKYNLKQNLQGQNYLQYLDPVHRLPLHVRAYDSFPSLGDERHAVETRPMEARSHGLCTECGLLCRWAAWAIDSYLNKGVGRS